MNAETKKALEESIAHWERMRDDPNRGEQPIAEECPLCELYIPWDCHDCPVAEATGLAYCSYTPYYEAAALFYKLKKSEIQIEQWHQAAQAEIDFLKSLLPQ